MIERLFRIIILSLFSCVVSNIDLIAKDRIEIKLDQLEDKYDSLPLQYLKQVKVLLKSHPQDIRVHLKYLTLQDRIGYEKRAKLEYQQLVKQYPKNQLYKYLVVRARMLGISWWDDDAEKKRKELLVELEPFTKVESIRYYALLNKAVLINNLKGYQQDLLKVAKLLMKLYPKKSDSHWWLAMAYAKNNMIEKLLALCEQNLKPHNEYIKTCSALGQSAKKLTKAQKAHKKKILYRLESIARESKDDQKFLKKLVNTFYSLGGKDNFKKVLAPLLAKNDPDWRPYSKDNRWLRDYAGVTTIADFWLFKEASQAGKNPDINKRIELLDKVLTKANHNKVLSSYIYMKKSTVYHHPLINKKKKELQAREKAVELDPNNKWKTLKLARAYIDQKVKIDKALDLLKNFDRKFSHDHFDPIVEHGDYSINWLMQFQEDYQELLRLKGRAYLVQENYQNAAKILRKAASIKPHAQTFYYLAAAEKGLKHNKAAFEWYLGTLAFADDSLKKEHKQDAQVNVKSFMEEYFAFGIEIDKLVRKAKGSWIKKYNLKEKEKKHPMVGLAAPALSIKTVDDTTFNLSDHRGKIVILSFWATWCPPCMEEIPLLNSLYEKYREKGVVVASFCIDSEDNEDDLVKMKKENGYTMPILLGNDDQKNAYKVIGIPTLMIIDKKGFIKEAISGYRSNLEDLLEEKINKM